MSGYAPKDYAEAIVGDSCQLMINWTDSKTFGKYESVKTPEHVNKGLKWVQRVLMSNIEFCSECWFVCWLERKPQKHADVFQKYRQKKWDCILSQRQVEQSLVWHHDLNSLQLNNPF